MKNYYLIFALFICVYHLCESKCPEPEDIFPCVCKVWNSKEDKNILQCNGQRIYNHELKIVGQQLKDNNYTFKAIEINDTHLTHIENNTFPTLVLEYISIHNNLNLNTIDSNAFDGSTVQNISIVHNPNLNPEGDLFALLRNLNIQKSIVLNSNPIEYIPSNALLDSNAVYVSLEYNKIHSIESNAFKSLPKLQYLDLNYNHISSIDNDAFSFSVNYTKLIISLNYNNLTEKSFAENSLTHLMYSKVYLHLEHNYFTDLPEKIFRPFIIENDHKIFLNQNQFNCNCGMKWIYDLPQSNRIYDIYCYLHRKSLFEMKKIELCPTLSTNSAVDIQSTVSSNYNETDHSLAPKLLPKAIHFYAKQCLNVHKDCVYDQNYTEQELENVKNYIQSKFAKTNPVQKPCDRLYVRKEVKCLTDQEIKDYAKAFRVLNKRGIMKNLVEIHDQHWAAGHKFNEGLLWHRWFNIQFQKELTKINPKVIFPYWEFPLDFNNPIKSKIWKYFGHSGTQNDDYCVRDGLFANLTVYYPQKHCLRREWNVDGKIDDWEPPEWTTSIIQSTITPNLFGTELAYLFKYSNRNTVFKSLREITDGFLTLNFQVFAVYSVQISYTSHFKTHLHCGGYNGDLSTSIAPNDPLFYTFHEFQTFRLYKWQLSADENLVPETYSLGVRLDWDTKEIHLSDIETDHLTYFKNVSVKEALQLGYGELCYIPEQFIKPINDIIHKRFEMPTAFNRLKKCLPPHLFLKWFPKFVLKPNSFTYFEHLLPEVGECNSKEIEGICRDLPIAKRFQSTENGKRQFYQFVNDYGFDMSALLNPIEDNYYDFINDLNKYDCCSPYV